MNHAVQQHDIGEPCGLGCDGTPHDCDNTSMMKGLKKGWFLALCVWKNDGELSVKIVVLSFCVATSAITQQHNTTYLEDEYPRVNKLIILGDIECGGPSPESSIVPQGVMGIAHTRKRSIAIPVLNEYGPRIQDCHEGIDCQRQVVQRHGSCKPGCLVEWIRRFGKVLERSFGS